MTELAPSAESDEEKTVLTITEKKANKIVKCLNEIFDEMFNEQSCILLQWYIPLTVEELLAIRWHMGEFDCAVKGGDYGLNNARDMSKLIPLLHIADLIASSVLESNEKQAL